MRLIAAYYASPLLRSMRQSLCGASAEPPLQPAFVASLAQQVGSFFAAAFPATTFADQLRALGGGGGGGGGGGVRVGGGDDDATAAAADARALSAEQRRALYACHLTFNGLPWPQATLPSSASSAEMLPFLAASLIRTSAAAGQPVSAALTEDIDAVYATAVRLAAHCGLGGAPPSR